MKTLIIFILLCAICVIGIGASQPQQRAWEYKFEYKVNEKKANELAAQGWELTAVGNEASGTMASIPFMVFRRSK